MATDSYERLSAQDSSFVTFERGATHMHVAAIATFEAAPLATSDGGLDVQRLGKYVDSRLHLVPRYRKKLAFAPIQGQAVWVDDAGFDLQYHLRHTSLPRPGSERELKELVGRLVSQPLDRDRPLWEMWVIEGLTGNRFALVSKVHHSMVDGASGMNLLTTMFRSTPDAEIEATPAWAPRPEPSGWELFVREQWRRARAPALVLEEAVSALRDHRAAWERLVQAGAAVGEAIEAGMRTPAATPLNQPIGPHRRVDWCSVPLTTLKAATGHLGGTVNDGILAVVCGGLRRFLGERGTELEGLDYRVVMPVDIRAEGDDFTAANRVSACFLSLPLDEPDPVRRLEIIRTETRRIKESRTAEGIALLTRLAEWTGAPLNVAGVRLVSWLHPYNLIVTNVPGPQSRLYLLGAPLLEMHPQLPLFENQGLGIAAMSYCGRVCIGLVGDRELAPDLGDLTHAIEASVDELAGAAALPGRAASG